LNKEEIKKLLHHREPYLMVDSVMECSAKSIRSTKIHQGNEPYILGHFHNAPVVPGAMLQELCTQSAGILLTKHYSPVENYDSNKTKGWAIGVLNRIKSAKYFGIVKPSNDINAIVELCDYERNLYTFKAKVFQLDELKAKLSFTLIITSDELLL
jgi:3-hydroxyacyl-[acyl-carrier-protein] dehydratase